MLDALDAAPWGVVLLAEDGRILAMSRRARAIDACGDGLAVHQGRLVALHRASAVRLDRLIGRVIANALAAAPEADEGGAMPAMRGGGGRLRRQGVASNCAPRSRRPWCTMASSVYPEA